MPIAAFHFAALLLCSSACGGSTSKAAAAEAAVRVNEPCAFVPRPGPPAALAAIVALRGLANVGRLAVAEPEPARGAATLPRRRHGPHFRASRSRA